MADSCASCTPVEDVDRTYRTVLRAALAVNLAMFVVEAGSGIAAGSVSLQADALDFLGDAANYGLGLWVLGRHVATRARASLVKAASMAAFGVWVLVNAVRHWQSGAPPDAGTMGAVGLLALAANVGVAVLLFRHRGGDSNRRSVWLCTRNDALGNVAVLCAALGVFGTGSGWPDLGVAVVMAGLALHSASRVTREAWAELGGSRLDQSPRAPSDA